MIIDEGRRFASAAFSVGHLRVQYFGYHIQLNPSELTFHILNPRFAADVSCIKEPLAEEMENAVAARTISSQRVAVFLA